MEAEMMATIDQEFDVKQKKALLSSLEKFRRDTFPQKNDHAVGEKTMPPEELRKHGGI